jgi:hypothetical protein
MTDFGYKINEILDELSLAVIEFNQNPRKPNYPVDSMFHVCMIFNSILLDKLWEVQEYDDMSIEDRANMAEAMGKELRTFIYKYTNIDMHKLTNELINRKKNEYTN